MAAELILRYLHFIAILAIAGTLTTEAVLLKRKLPRRRLSTIARVDLWYGIAALVLLGAGLTLWLGGIGKPTEWYSQNWIFMVKLSLYITIGLLSIYPTIFFLKKRKGDPHDEVPIPAAIRWSVYAELVLLSVIPALAGMMARGIGLEL